MRRKYSVRTWKWRGSCPCSCRKEPGREKTAGYSCRMLREVTKAVLATLGDTLRSRAALVAENTLLRQQVIVLHRAAPHPRLKPRDVRKVVAEIAEGLREDAPLRLARSRRETLPTLGLLARNSVGHRTVVASTAQARSR